MSASFSDFCKLLQEIRETRNSSQKVTICADYLSGIESDVDIGLAVQFIEGKLFSSSGENRTLMGSRTAGLAASEFCGIDYERVFKPCREAAGGYPEAIGRLLHNIPTAAEKRTPEQLTLQQVNDRIHELATVKSRSGKIDFLQNAWCRMTPVEVKYFTRLLSKRSLQIGFESQNLIASIAKAYGHNFREVQYVRMITGSTSEAACLANHDRLEEAVYRPLSPLSYMSAAPAEILADVDLNEYLAEEKIEGIRSQVHLAGDRVVIYSDNLTDITGSFPEISRFFKKNRNLPDLVLDGVISVYRENAIQHSYDLQKRVGLNDPSKKVKREIPVLFIAYDILCLEGEPLFDSGLEGRREKLCALADAAGLPLTNQFSPETAEELSRLLERSSKRGNKGLILKKRDSRYEYGSCNDSWLKVITSGPTLKTILMYAHVKDNRRPVSCSEFTLGIGVQEDKRYEEEYIPIGRLNSGYSKEELAVLNSKIDELKAERYGTTYGLKPGVVIEVEFDGIQVNKRTKAGFTLRKMRFRSIRGDLSPGDADTLAHLEALCDKMREKERFDQDEDPSILL